MSLYQESWIIHFIVEEIYYNRRTNKKDRDGKTIKLDEDNIIMAEGKHEIVVSPEVWDSVHAKRTEIAGRYKRQKTVAMCTCFREL